MPLAFVLINTEPDHTERVLEALRKIDAVEEAYMVYGVHDIVAKVKADTMDDLNKVVTWHVRHLDNIRQHSVDQTIIVVDETK